jgi:hypothetical protein
MDPGSIPVRETRMQQAGGLVPGGRMLILDSDAIEDRYNLVQSKVG